MVLRSRRIAPRGQRPTFDYIEVVAPDDPSWWDDAPAASIFPTPLPHAVKPQRRRHRLVATGCFVLALVAAGAVAMSIDDKDQDPAATAGGHFIIDGSGLIPYTADIVTPPPTDAHYTLFASGNPTNPWISLQTYRRRDQSAVLDSWRREVDGRNLITPRDERSMTAIVVDLDNGWAADVRAFNVDDHQLVRFANALTLADGATGKVLIDEDMLAAYSLMSTRTATWADELLYGTVTTEMRAATVDGELVTLREASGDVDTRAATLAYFTTGRVEGSDGYTAATLTPSGESIVTWAAEGRLLSLTGQVPTTELLSISRSVRLADGAEWRGLVYGLHPDYRLGDFAEVGTGAAENGSPWSNGIQLAQRGVRTEYLWWWTLPGTEISDSIPTGVDLAADPGNETVVVGNATYVFVWVPADSETRVATVRAADGTTVNVQLSQVFADIPVRAASTRIDVPGEVAISTA